MKNRSGLKICAPILGASLALGLVVTASQAAFAQEETWVTPWATSLSGPWQLQPSQYDDGFVNTTIRQVLQLNSGADKVRVRFSNQFGDTPLLITSAYAGIQVEGAEVENNTRISFSGRDSVSIEPGGVWFSDPVDINVEDGENLVVSIFLDEQSPVPSSTQGGSAISFIANGDVAAEASADGFELLEPVGFFLKTAFYIQAVDVISPGLERTVVVIGDSLGAGGRNTWPGMLAGHLKEVAPEYVVANVAVGGNRALTSTDCAFGAAGVARLANDVFALSGVDTVIAMWVNDINMQSSDPNSSVMLEMEESGMPFECFGAKEVSADDLIAGYKQIMAQAHDRGLKVVFGTTTPSAGNRLHDRPGNPEIWFGLNEWIMTNEEADAAIDFAAAIGEPGDDGIPRIRDGLHSGDYLHFSDDGKAILAKAASDVLADLLNR